MNSYEKILKVIRDQIPKQKGIIFGTMKKSDVCTINGNDHEIEDMWIASHLTDEQGTVFLEKGDTVLCHEIEGVYVIIEKVVEP